MSPSANSYPSISEESSFSFQDLLEKIAIFFESDQIDVDALKQLLMSYRGQPSEWVKYAQLSEERYTRVLVDSGNGKYNLMLLCWPPTKGSTIHNHPDSHCIVKVLSGSLSEARYCWPQVRHDSVTINSENEMEIKCETKLDPKIPEKSVTYINDSIGLHRCLNSDKSTPAFSLHLYCPPFNHCQVFDEKTGKYCQVNVSYDSEVKNLKYRLTHQHYFCKNSDPKSFCLQKNDQYTMEKDILIFEREQ